MAANGAPALERENRKALWDKAPNFSAPRDGACVPGDDAVMRAVWSEHRLGGRVAAGWPASNLVPFARSSGRGRNGKAAEERRANQTAGRISYGKPPYWEMKRMVRVMSGTREGKGLGAGRLGSFGR